MLFTQPLPRPAAKAIVAAALLLAAEAGSVAATAKTLNRSLPIQSLTTGRPIDFRTFIEYSTGRVFQSYRRGPEAGGYIDEELDYFDAGFNAGYIGFESYSYWSKPLLTGFQVMNVRHARHPAGGKSIDEHSVLFTKATTRYHYGFFDMEYGMAGYATLSGAGSRTKVRPDQTIHKTHQARGLINNRSYPLPAFGARFWPGRMVSFSVDFLTGESRPVYGFLTGSFWLNFPEASYIVGWENFSIDNIVAPFETNTLTSGVYFKYQRHIGTQCVWARLTHLIDTSGLSHKDSVLDVGDRFYLHIGYGVGFSI